MVDELTIKCKYWKEGCEQLFKAGDLKPHSTVCPFYPVVCPNSGCDYVAARRLMKDHTPTCEFKTEICQKGCLKVLKLSEVGNHNCIASLTNEVKTLKVNETLLKEEVMRQKEMIKELEG